MREIEWTKATCFESVVTSIIEQEQQQPGSIFYVRDLNNTYVDMLSKYEVEETVNTTRFQERLQESIPDLYSRQ